MFKKSPSCSFFLNLIFVKKKWNKNCEISILVKILQNLDFGQHFKNSWFWYIFSTNLDFDQNYHDISIFVKIYDNLDFRNIFDNLDFNQNLQNSRF